MNEDRVPVDPQMPFYPAFDTETIEARFTAIELTKSGGIKFTVESRYYGSVTMKYPETMGFIRSAMALIPSIVAPKDTDEFLNVWFDLPADTRKLFK